MILYNHFIINPDSFRIPHYSISPFSTEWVSKNARILKTQNIDRTLIREYFGNYRIFYNGRSALYNVLMKYNLGQDDEISILTPSDNVYISSCVTGEVEKICKWSRAITERTKLILVNHEFGTVYKNMGEIMNLNLPVIEDMAMSMLSTDDKGNTGNYGDFTIYSMSKFFPMQTGGIAKANNKRFSWDNSYVNDSFSEYTEALLSFHLQEIESNRQARLSNNKLFESNLSRLNLKSHLCYSENEVPSVYMSSVPDNVDLDSLKTFLQSNGIEASIFYGERAFFVPVHQNLKEEDIDYICSLIEFFLKRPLYR